FVVDAAARLAAFPLPPWRTEADVVGAETRGLREAFASGRHRDDLLVAVGEPDGEPLGFVYLERLVDYFTGRPHGHVSMLVVVPAAEGRGIATALLRAADDWGRTNGY